MIEPTANNIIEGDKFYILQERDVLGIIKK